MLACGENIKMKDISNSDKGEDQVPATTAVQCHRI
jgi:hypothetical protein